MMKKITTAAISLLFASSTSLLVAEVAKPTQAPHWSYNGAIGAEHWGDLSPHFSTCKTGKNQSPINIDSDAVEAKLTPIKFKYTMLTADKIVNTGHSIKVDMWSGGSITVDNQVFDLKQFHFHTPSENTINGKHAPLAAHFVHLNKAGDIAVVAMLFEPGKSDRTLATLVKSMPNTSGQSNKLDSAALKNMEGEFKSSDYFRFNGSLTTPPCTEGVRWIVMRKPMSISDSQLLAFQKALKQPNNRPVQPLNARIVTK
jgi:carbonic anhydrase